MKKILLIGVTLVMLITLLGAVPASAVGPHTIDFESDTDGAKPNGWQSADSMVTFFTDSDGADLYVDDYGDQSDGQALAVNHDDPSYLIMDFTVPMQSISLDFGNDDPGWVHAGEEAVLTLYYMGTQVGEERVVMNINDLMDQTISFSGAIFDSATFYYDVAGPFQGGTGLIEIVDNIDLLPIVDFTKEITSVVEAGDMDGVLETGEDWWWTLEVNIENLTDETITVEKLHDRLGGDMEWHVISWSPGLIGEVETKTKGKTEKVFINFYDGFELAPGQSVLLFSMVISPDMNTGNGNGKNNKFPDGHQEFTSAGEHCLNSGATISGYIGDVPIEVSSNRVCVDVEEFVDTPPAG